LIVDVGEKTLSLQHLSGPHVRESRLEVGADVQVITETVFGLGLGACHQRSPRDDSLTSRSSDSANLQLNRRMISSAITWVGV
jgi:hypothetical protein